ncbi:MAG: efflux RND transporter periplasmic adaptor subunit [Deltaproteobacteria bacterium]|nr:efflux RND transporter periplasmic adaptor subunit [Deltaproteobacteria bacterium]MBN2672016.1 efflux RND transporter periplasmic adaptor subunit [Deltaproteobacteria bacterium]
MNHTISRYFILMSALFLLVDCKMGAATAEETEHQTSATEQSSKASSDKVVKVQKLSGTAYSQSLELSGKTVAKKESTLSLPVSGMVKEIKVKLGDSVKEGDVLLKLDRKNYQLGVQQAEAGLAAAVAQDELLSNETVRLKNLVAENAAPTASMDELSAQKKGAVAQVQIADSNVAKAKKALADSVLRAPFDGVVSSILIEKGEQCYAMPPTMLMTVVDTSTLEVQVFVPEESASKVKVGDAAIVTIDSAGMVVEGKVTFVANTISQGARTFEVRIEVDNTAQEIKAGAFARVNLNQNVKTDAIFVPIAAVLRDDEQNPYVFVVKQRSAQKQMVTLGAVEGTRVMVKEGLTDGAEIIVSNAGSVIDGQRVRTEKR